MDYAKNIASQMILQLGGKQFLTMTGAKVSYTTGEYLTEHKSVYGKNADVTLLMKLQSKQTNSFNIHDIRVVEQSLMFDDTYTFKFWGKGDKLIKEVNNVYFDEVQDLFERETNLLVSYNNRSGSGIKIQPDGIVK
jgi:hypothetical protein